MIKTVYNLFHKYWMQHNTKITEFHKKKLAYLCKNQILINTSIFFFPITHELKFQIVI